MTCTVDPSRNNKYGGPKLIISNRVPTD